MFQKIRDNFETKRRARLDLRMRTRVFDVLVFGAWLLAAMASGVGIQEYGASIDGAGFGLAQRTSWATVLFATLLAGVHASLVYVKYQGYFGTAACFILGPVAWYGTVLVGFQLLPMHYGYACDTMESVYVCDAATFRERDSCEPSDQCFPRIEKACRLGSQDACKVVMNYGWTKQDVCDAWQTGCAQAQACSDSREACVDDHHHMFVNLRVCETWAEVCEASP